MNSDYTNDYIDTIISEIKEEIKDKNNYKIKEGEVVVRLEGRDICGGYEGKRI